MLAKELDPFAVDFSSHYLLNATLPFMYSTDGVTKRTRFRRISLMYTDLLCISGIAQNLPCDQAGRKNVSLMLLNMEKKMILAIALYAAAVVMIMHNLHLI